MDTSSWFDWLVLVLAIDAFMVIWFRGGWFATIRLLSPFQTIRAYGEAWETSNKWRKRLMSKLISFIGYPFSCTLCLPLHFAFWLFIARTFIPHSDIGLYILAAGALAGRLYNDVWKAPLEHKSDDKWGVPL